MNGFNTMWEETLPLREASKWAEPIKTTEPVEMTPYLFTWFVSMRRCVDRENDGRPSKRQTLITNRSDFKRIKPDLSTQEAKFHNHTRTKVERTIYTRTDEHRAVTVRTIYEREENEDKEKDEQV